VALTGGPEAAVEAVARVFQVYLTPYLEAQWTLAGDVATCPKPYPTSGSLSWLTQGATVQLHDVLVPEYPVVWVTALHGQMTANMGPVLGEFNHIVNAQACIKGDDGVVIEQQAERFAWAMVKCIQTRQMEIGSTLVNHVSTTPQQYSINRAADGRDLVRYINWQLAVLIEENFS
jgi:hypothetical protein